MSRDLTRHSEGSVWDFMSEVERALDDVWRSPQGRKNELSGFSPAVDVHETDGAYLVSMDVPGIPQSDIKIDSQNGRLTVSGERAHTEKKDDKMFQRIERSFGRFERSFQMPKDVNESKIEARYHNGVLEITLPKLELAKPRSIQIENKGVSEKGGSASH